MFELHQCNGCKGLFESKDLFLINGGEELFCSKCNESYEEDFEVVEIKINE